MGVGSSKEKAALSSQLEELNEKYKAALQTIALRENQISEKEKELESAKREAADAQGLKTRVEELEQQILTLKEEKDREVGRLQDELSKELSGQLRVAESLTQERNLARKEVGQLKEKLADMEGKHGEAVKKLEDAGKTSSEEAEKAKVELEKDLKAKVEELQSVKAELEGLKIDNGQLEESAKTSGEELTAAKGKIAAGDKEKEGLNKQLDDLRKKLEESEKSREQLTQGSRSVNDELAAARTAAEGETKKQKELQEQLSSR